MNSNFRFVLIVSLSFLVVLSLGCKKSLFKRHAHGKVIDKTDQTPVPFAIITIWSQTSNGHGGGGMNVLVTTQCDKNGEFDVKYNTDFDTHCVSADAEHYYSIGYDDRLNMDSKNQVIALEPKTFVVAHLNITDPNIHYVYFIINHNSQNNGLDAQPGITEKRYEVYGNQMNTYTYAIHYNNASTITKIDSIFCPKFDKPEAVVNINL